MQSACRTRRLPNGNVAARFQRADVSSFLGFARLSLLQSPALVASGTLETCRHNLLETGVGLPTRATARRSYSKMNGRYPEPNQGGADL